MDEVILQRILEKDEEMYGVLVIGRPRFVTLEDGWKGNQRNVSCIPSGEYVCEEWESPKFGRTYKVMDVPNRDGILFHAGNRKKDTSGCILVGSSFDSGLGGGGIRASKVGFDGFLRLMRGIREFKLIVRGPIL